MWVSTAFVDDKYYKYYKMSDHKDQSAVLLLFKSVADVTTLKAPWQNPPNEKATQDDGSSLTK